MQPLEVEGGPRTQVKPPPAAAMRQFSIRSVAVGLLVGTLMCFTNMYFGLQTGWVTMGSLQSAILGYGIFKVLKQLGLVSGFSIAENVIVQTTSVATATMPLAAGFVGVIPALNKLTAEENPPDGPYHFSQLQLIVWSMTLAFFGVFVAIPLRTQVIEREQLKFPSGTATAQVIKTLHAVPMDEDDDPDPRRVVQRLGTCPSRVPSRSDAPFGFRFHSTQSSLNLQYSRRSSDILLSSALEDTQAFSTQVQRPSPISANTTAAVPWALIEEDDVVEEKAYLAGVDVSSIERTWVALLASFLVAFLITCFAAVIETMNKLRKVKLPTALPLFGTAAAAYGWKLGANAGYIGQGIIMGPRVCFSMLAGSVVGFGILAPLAVQQGWANTSSSSDGYAAFVTWVAMSIMIADSLTSLAVLLCRYAFQMAAEKRRSRGYASLGNPELPIAARFEESTPFVAASERQAVASPAQHGSSSLEPVLAPAPEAEASEICEKFPDWIWISGIVVSIIMATGVFGYLFPMPHWQVAVAMLLAMLVAVLAVRALGETDLNPVSGIGKLTQVCFALISPGKVLHNLVAGAISEAAAMQAGDMMQDFKTAYLLGVCPKAQFAAALIGSLASCGISTAAYALFSSVYEIGGDKLPAPTAEIWLDMARLVTGGSLPPHVVTYCWGGALLGVLMALLPELLSAIESKPHLSPSARAAFNAANWVMPSSIGFAVGMYISPEFVLPRVIGGVLSIPSIWAWAAPPKHRGNMLITASGLVLGEGIGSMLATIVKSFLS